MLKLYSGLYSLITCLICFRPFSIIVISDKDCWEIQPSGPWGYSVPHFLETVSVQSLKNELTSSMSLILSSNDEFCLVPFSCSPMAVANWYSLERNVIRADEWEISATLLLQMWNFPPCTPVGWCSLSVFWISGFQLHRPSLQFHTSSLTFL